MMTARKDLLSGTPDEVADKLEKLSQGIAPHEYKAGTQLHSLAVELTKNPDIQVSLVTYENESQELEVSLTRFAGSDPVLINRNSLGDHCQVTYDLWIKIGTSPDIEKAAEIVRALLRIPADPA